MGPERQGAVLGVLRGAGEARRQNRAKGSDRIPSQWTERNGIQKELRVHKIRKKKVHKIMNKNELRNK